ncbi:hypothetical protein A6X21_18615 [Planctopirus hydrillae]|uniref:Uncharacterized protein n=1 Tax=Planctopirus hydrillae TaxID=1841610 RepID=A0A1C3EK02_9PLAN|nr:hypothetical protein A6X21_18615 [Planctopirus hydrillae]
MVVILRPNGRSAGCRAAGNLIQSSDPFNAGSVCLKPEMIRGGLPSGAVTVHFTNHRAHCHTGLSVSAQVKDRLISPGTWRSTGEDRKIFVDFDEECEKKRFSNDPGTNELP